jgi:hypothetical protein
MDLFLDKTPEFVKEAAFASRLSEQPENWPQELTSELMKQLPYLSDYNVNVNLDRVDPERGFAFGYADVSSKTERPEIEHSEMGIPHIRIPLIVMDRSVKPFSVFLDGEKVLPLTEDRIRGTLFNPATFDLSTAIPRDPSLVEPLMPPQRSGIGMGGEYKLASVNPEMLEKKSLLLDIAPTLREDDVEEFVDKIASDPYLVAGFRRNGFGPVLVDALENTKRASAEDRLVALSENIAPTVVTVQKLPGGDFLFKSANVHAFVFDKIAAGEVVPEAEAAQVLGEEQAQQMQPGQTATAVTDPVEDVEPISPSKAKIVEEFGQYKVQDAMGNSLLGHVFPQTLAWDGNFTPQSVALFTNGSAYSLQDSIAGELVGKGTNLPSDEPRGDGCFYGTEGGDAIATQPLTIGSSMAGPDGLPTLQGTDSFGNPVSIQQVEGVRHPTRLADNLFAIPGNWKFMRLNNQTQVESSPESAADVGMAEAAPQQPKAKAPAKPAAKKPEEGGKKKVKLAPTPESMGKAAAVQAAGNEVTLFYNGGYNLQGGCGLEKISSELTQDLDAVTAEFMLGLLGVDGATAKMKVAEARKKKMVKLSNLKTITTLAERYSTSVKEASAIISMIPDLKKDLVKEAAAIDDEETVDKILALNFVNPENLSTFVNYIPEFDNASEKLAEMLLFSYMGAKELPEGAISRAMKGMEETLSGLKNIASTEN